MTRGDGIRALRRLRAGGPARGAAAGAGPAADRVPAPGATGAPGATRAPGAAGARPPDAAHGGSSAPGTVCDFCAQPLPPGAERHGHRHVVDLHDRALRCACPPCALLFTQHGAGGGRYRTAGDRVLSDPTFALTDEQWRRLQIPVGLAFFFTNSDLGRTVAFYPGPAGATESLLHDDVWDELVVASPALADMAPDVEALLVRRTDRTGHTGHTDHAHGGGFLVPIDVCYELVGMLRRTWRGIDGGAEAHAAVDELFARLHARSRPATTVPGP